MASNTVTVKRSNITLPNAKPVAETVRALIDPPLEISRAFLHGLNMVDETIIVRNSLRQPDRRS